MGEIILSWFKSNSIYPDDSIRPTSQITPFLGGVNKIYPQEKDEFLDCIDPDSGVAAELSQIIHQKSSALSEATPSNITLSTLAETRCHSVNINPFSIQFLDKLRENQPLGNKQMAMIRSGSPELNARYRATFFVDQSTVTAPLFMDKAELTKKLYGLFMDVLDDHAQYSLNREIKYTHHCWMISDPEDKSKQRLEESLAYLVEEVFIPKQILDAKAAARPAAKAAKNRWDAWARERPEESDEALEALEAQNMWKASNDPYFKDIWDVWGEMVTEETKARLNDKIVWDYWDALDDRGNEAICCVMLAYLDRYLATKLDHLHFKNMNQLMLSAALLAGKWLEDLPLFCKDYAAMVGMGVKDLAELEMLFAKDIDFDFYVSAELIEEYRQGLFNYTPLSLENRISSPVSPLSF